MSELPKSYYQVRAILNFISLTELEIREQESLCTSAHCEGVYEGKKKMIKELYEK